MKAAIYQGKEKIVIQDIPKPVPKKGQALIKVKYAGICGSDLEFFKSGLWPGRGVLGHEITGTIAELGSEVKKWKEGDRVSIDCSINCGKCVYCQKGYNAPVAIHNTTTIIELLKLCSFGYLFFKIIAYNNCKHPRKI